MPHAVVADLAFELVDELRALGPRADEAHLAAQHVEELRQLVQPRLADERADAGHSVVVGGRPARHAIAFGLGAHATKLDQATPEERRGGKEFVSTVRPRWSPAH